MIELGIGNSIVMKEFHDTKFCAGHTFFNRLILICYILLHLTRQVSVFNTCIYYLYLLGASKFARPL